MKKRIWIAPLLAAALITMTTLHCNSETPAPETASVAPKPVVAKAAVDPIVGVWRFQKMGAGSIWLWCDVSSKVVFFTDPRVAPGMIGINVYEAAHDTGGSWRQADGIYTLSLERHKESAGAITSENLPALRAPLSDKNRISWMDYYKWSGLELLRVDAKGTPSKDGDKLVRVPKGELERITKEYPNWIFKPLVDRVLQVVPASVGGR